MKRKSMLGGLNKANELASEVVSNRTFITCAAQGKNRDRMLLC